MQRLLLSLACFCLTTSLAHAQARWTLTTSDFESQPAQLLGLSPAGVQIRDAQNADKTIALDHFISVELQTPGAPHPPGKFRVVMADGASATGQPRGLTEEQLRLDHPMLGELTFALKRITRIESTGRSTVRIPAASPTEDIVQLVNGDTIRGFVQGLSSTAVTVKAGDAASDVPLDTVAAVVFATSANTAAAAPMQPGFRVRLADGSIVAATSATLSGTKLSLAFSAGETRTIELSGVLALEQTNGPVSWLSSLPPSENISTPYLDAQWPARMDKSVTGETIRSGNRTFAHGIGVHSRSRLTWPLDGTYKFFRTQYAIDGAMPYADVEVRILLDGQPAHRVEHVKAGALSPVVLLDLGNAKSITLEVDYGAGYDVQDRLNWIEPALLRSRPLATQPATQP